MALITQSGFGMLGKQVKNYRKISFEKFKNRQVYTLHLKINDH
jgi:hypothetical protein